MHFKTVGYGSFEVLCSVLAVRIQTKLFDYNLFQFNEISGDHLDALLSMISDAELKDTILITGNVNKTE